MHNREALRTRGSIMYFLFVFIIKIIFYKKDFLQNIISDIDDFAKLFFKFHILRYFSEYSH